MKSILHYRTFFRSFSTLSIGGALMMILHTQCTSTTPPRPSPLRSDSAQVHGLDAYIEFSSPGVKSREIFGAGEEFLVPFGKMWRTGANDATFLSFNGDVLINTMELDSGTYSLFTIPNQNEWMIVFNHEWKQWGSYDYKDSLDVFRIKVSPRYVDQSQERMLFYFADDSLKFRWDNVRWALPINPRP